MKIWLRRSVMILLGLAVVGVIALALIPKPVPVDMVQVNRGPLAVTVDDDGRTRIRERYTISAPLAGRLLRIDLDPGDNAERGQLLAAIEPRDPDLLDARARAESRARVESAQAAVKQADAHLRRAGASLKLASDDARKFDEMYKNGSATPKERDDAALVKEVRSQEHSAAQFAAQVTQFQMQLAEAALTHTATDDRRPPDERLKIHAPCGGRVLRVFEESEGFITPGTPLLEFGDPTDLEIVVDVLSTNAVAVKPGNNVTIDHWGGDEPLRGRVRVVEPAAFTKASSLGVEEQRVNVIIDFIDPPVVRKGLGDSYRIEASITIWNESDILSVPTSALFRKNQKWYVYRVKDSTAELIEVNIGQRNGMHAQIISGLAEGDLVVAYPSDEVKNGVDVVSRDAEGGHVH